MMIKDEKTRRIVTLLSWLLLAASLALVEWSHSKIIAIVLLILITAVAVFNFFSTKKAEEKNNERDQKANDSTASMRENQIRRILYLLSWFIFAMVTAVIIWRYSKIAAIVLVILITAVTVFVMKKAENSKDNSK
ncbi:hypothetical protein ACVR0O_00565 [Streptococcus caviae]|uniref:hypothetical protein n=1 Tax=Streptococcus sp. 'caviae' TaxID=1915004 RepID=UPI00094BA9D8|nr:hypothetical protein [Streptococcus sp. 'caviae']OLN84765.1 hypothetical protein BMI76_01410 [Streptococcus sp. 'caviae']